MFRATCLVAIVGMMAACGTFEDLGDQRADPGLGDTSPEPDVPEPDPMPDVVEPDVPDDPEPDAPDVPDDSGPDMEMGCMGPNCVVTLVASSSSNHTCAQTRDGRAQCWGNNNQGQVGDGLRTLSTHTPTRAFETLPDLTGISAGLDFTCVISGGLVYCVGANDHGQLGVLDSVLGEPVPVPPIQNATRVTTGRHHACALAYDQNEPEIWCWGSNDFGQLGNSTQDIAILPRRVFLPLSGATPVDIKAGDEHTCALTQEGGVWCWGGNDFGQLGRDVVEDRSVDTDSCGFDANDCGPDRLCDRCPGFIRELNDATALSIGELHNCAINTSEVWCWGNNESGQVGLESPVPLISPVVVPITDFVPQTVSAGGEHACAADGETVWCWGNNDFTQLGISGFGPAPTEVGFVGALTALSSGHKHTCGIKPEENGMGHAWCWGLNHQEQAGRNRVQGVDPFVGKAPARVEGGPANMVELSVGDEHTCGLNDDNHAYCWGSNSHGQLGIVGEPMAALRPSPLFAGSVVSIDVGAEHTCTTDQAGKVRCFGAGNDNQLGTPFALSRADTSRDSPGGDLPVDPLSPVAELAMGLKHTCARTMDEQVFCWGNGDLGQLGNGFREFTVRPLKVQIDALALSSGLMHTCALRDGGSVSCWGLNDGGAFGVCGTGDCEIGPFGVASEFACDSNACALDPVGLPGFVGAQQIETGLLHTCALLGNGEVACLGQGSLGQLGSGTLASSSTPVTVTGLSNVRQITAGALHTCAVNVEGQVWCWGGHDDGQLGPRAVGQSCSGAGQCVPTATPVDGLEGFVLEVVAGERHTCALLRGGDVLCWGANGLGQLGANHRGDVVGFSDVGLE